MEIAFDPGKNRSNIERHGLDMASAVSVFAGPTLTVIDDRKDYGEIRFITIGHLDGRMVVMVWTQRGEIHRIISLRKADDREHALYAPRFV